jgi:short-subunit dehydrogenase
LIAGGSEGIGLEFARKLAARGINLLLLARRKQPLLDAQTAIGEEFDGVQVRVAALDLSTADLPERLVELTAGLEIGMLIYNAGASHGLELFHDAPLHRALQMIALNCSGPATLCHELGGRMRARRRGGIILLSSLSAFCGSAYIATYAASKAFDIGFAESLWAELKPYNVDVLSLVIGATDTPAMSRAGADMSAIPPLTSAQVAEEGLARLGKGPIHVVGELGQMLAEAARGGDREELIDNMSSAAASMFGMTYPPEPT